MMVLFFLYHGATQSTRMAKMLMILFAIFVQERWHTAGLSLIENSFGQSLCQTTTQ